MRLVFSATLVLLASSFSFCQSFLCLDGSASTTNLIRSDNFLGRQNQPGFRLGVAIVDRRFKKIDVGVSVSYARYAQKYYSIQIFSPTHQERIYSIDILGSVEIRPFVHYNLNSVGKFRPFISASIATGRTIIGKYKTRAESESNYQTSTDTDSYYNWNFLAGGGIGTSFPLFNNKDAYLKLTYDFGLKYINKPLASQPTSQYYGFKTKAISLNLIIPIFNLKSNLK